MPVVLSILRLPTVLGLLLALLVCSGCGQATARPSAPDHASTVAQVADEQRADVVVEPHRAEPAVEQPVTSPQPLLFADDRPEPYRPRGPPGLTFLPMFPAPLILPLDVRMPSELGIVVERVVRGQHVVMWAAISPVGWRVGAVQTVGFRYYNPVTGRYLNRDPIGYGDGMNVYCYVHNNPINNIDPLGLETFFQALARTIREGVKVLEDVPIVGPALAQVSPAVGAANFVAGIADAGTGTGEQWYANVPDEDWVDKTVRIGTPIANDVATITGIVSPKPKPKPKRDPATNDSGTSKAQEGTPRVPDPKDGAYHGPKPKYTNPGHHDRKHPNFRGGGEKNTTPLPSDAEEVYKNAIPTPDGKSWYGRNAEGDVYRYHGVNGEVHWSGRKNSEAGLKVPEYIQKRFKEQDKAK